MRTLTRLALRVLKLLGLFLLLIIASTLADQLPIISDLDARLADHELLRRGLLTLTIGMCVAGGLLMLIGPFAVRGAGGPQRVEEPQADLVRARRAALRYSDSASWGSLRQALVRDAWRSEPRWQRLLLMLAGAALVYVGLCGLLFVLGPPLVRVLMVGMVLYAIVLIGRGLTRHPELQDDASMAEDEDLGGMA
jgi:ABC-type multidrug transport system fused ATPase/permease subunit